MVIVILIVILLMTIARIYDFNLRGSLKIKARRITITIRITIRKLFTPYGSHMRPQTPLNSPKIKIFDRIYRMFRMVRYLCGIEPTHNSVDFVHSVEEFVRSGMSLDASVPPPLSLINSTYKEQLNQENSALSTASRKYPLK